MNVFELVTEEFNIDDQRFISGVIRWAELAPTTLRAVTRISGRALPAVAGGSMAADFVEEEAVRHIPFLVIQGSDDQTVRVSRSRESVARMRELGMQHLYIEIEGGDHSLFISRNPRVVEHLFSFFNLVAKTHGDQHKQ